MTYINIAKFVLINELEKDHSMIETRRLKNIVIFIQKILHYIFFFCDQKTTKNRQALHEILRASSLSTIFIELSSRPAYPNMVVKKMKNL